MKQKPLAQCNKELKKLLEPNKKAPLSEEQKIAKIEYHMEQILDILGLDKNNDSLAKTPNRVAKMYVKELFCGLDKTNYPNLSFIHDAPKYENICDMVFIKDISMKSICEHHFLPMVGKAQIAYIPGKKIIGLSKFNRIVNYFCRRPQIQERLTSDIAKNLKEVLETEDVAVFTRLQHFCVTHRGPKDELSLTECSSLHGKLKKDPLLRQEFFIKIPQT